MIGQIQIPMPQPNRNDSQLEMYREELIHLADQSHLKLKERGGGMQGMSFRHITYDEPNEIQQDMVVVHLD